MDNTLNKDSHLARGYTFALLSALVLSTTAILIRYLTQTYQLPALILAVWRDGFVTLSLLPVLVVVSPRLLKTNRQDVRYLAWFGLVLAFFNAIWTLSVSLNGAAIATVLAYSSAGFTALLGRWLLKEKLDWAKILAVALSLAGCVLVSGAWESAAWQANPAGILTGLLSGLFYAIYTLMGRAASQRGLNPWTTLLYTFGFATLFLLGANLIPGGIIPGGATTPGDLLWLGNHTTGWAVLVLLAAGPTLAGFGFYNISLTHLPSSVVNLIVTLEPAFTALIAYFFLNERLTGIQVGGSLVILAGVVVLRLYEQNGKKNHLAV